MVTPRGANVALSLLILVGIRISCLANHRACAGSGSSVQTPANGKPTASGLILTVDTDWVDGPGYRPVRIAVTSSPPAVADRTLSFEFKIYSDYGNEVAISVSKDLELPAGAAAASTILSVPQYSPWLVYSLDVWEDGQHVPQLSISLTGMTWNGGSNPYCPNMLCISDSNPPNLTSLIQWLSNAGLLNLNSSGNYSGTMPPVMSGGPGASGVPSLVIRTAGNLPGGWIQYSCLDVISVSVDDLDRLAKQNPDVHKALIDWTKLGGNLWVHGLGDDGSRLASLEKLLAIAEEVDPTEKDPTMRGWTTRTKEELAAYLKESDPTASQQGSYTGGYSGDQPPQPSLQLPNPDDVMRWLTGNLPPLQSFVSRDVQLGRVVALAAQNPYAGSLDDWKVLFAETGADRWKWTQRHGIVMGQENPAFWNFLIAGVGLAPVDAFRILITLFVLLIGPVNYWILRQKKRLHLLLFTVPASALAITAVLLIYAVVGDGLSVRLRARTYTALDQSSGEAQSWSRLSYYAGLAPSQGLEFPSDTVVLPLEGQFRDRGGATSRTMSWTTRQRMTRGWLDSRTPTQYMVVRACATRRELKYLPPVDAASPAQIENHLDTKIHHLAVCDPQGNLLYAHDVPPDAKAQLQSADAAQGYLDMQTAFRTHTPQVPLEMQSYYGGTESIFGIRHRRYSSSQYQYFGYASGRSSVQSEQGASRLEDGIRSAYRYLNPNGATAAPDLSGDGVVTTNSLAPPTFAARTYVALVERSPETPLGTIAAREEDSFHVIVGRW